jgi:hypothetical protein
MGHMNQRCQNIRSTLRTPVEDVPTTDTHLGTNTHLVYAVLVDQGQLYTDLTGKLPVRPNAYDHIHQELTAKGFKQKLQTLDNEASAAWSPPTATAATPLNEPSELLKNTLSQGSPM